MLRSLLYSCFLFVTCCAHQPFEPLFLNGGIAPLERHPAASSVLVLHSTQQFMERVLESGKDTVVCVVDGVSRASDAFVAQVAEVSQEAVHPFSVVCVQGHTDMALVASIGATIGVPAWQPPCAVVFVKGAAVLPLLTLGDGSASLSDLIAQRFVFAAQSNQASWWARIDAVLRGVWAWMCAVFSKISDFLFRW